MKGSTLIGVALESILRNKMRSALTMLGIIIGVAAVIMVVALGTGARHQVQDRIGRLGTNLIVVTPGSTSLSGVSQGAQSFNRLTIADAEALKAQSFLLSGVSPVVNTFAQIVGGSGNWRAPVHGVSTDYQAIRDWTLESGAFFTAADLKAMRKVVVIGHTVAANLFAGEDATGREIRLGSVPFRIVGVLAAKGQAALGGDQDDVVLAPYTTVQTRLAGRTFISQILAGAGSPGELDAVQADIRAIMRVSHGLTAGEPDDFTVRDQADLAATAGETTRVMTLLLSAIASVSLLVGGIGIMNIMLVSVTERTREIGLRRALGARATDILTQFLIESLVMSIAGGLIGVALGGAGSRLLHVATGWGVSISAPTVTVALLFAAAVGVFFGYYPARRAARLVPIEALRFE